MKKAKLLGNSIQPDYHVKLFEKEIDLSRGVFGVHYTIFNTYGTEIEYEYQSGHFSKPSDLKYYTDWVESRISFKEYPNLYYSYRMDDLFEKWVLNIMVMNPVTDTAIPVAMWNVIFEVEADESQIEEYLLKFNGHYLEQMSHHIQMVLINYERLYYIIDVYTDLLINKDKFMPYHMTNVANWCMKLVPELGLEYKDQMVLYISALLHDIGKLHISDDMLNKPTKLDESEYHKVKTHPMKSYQMAHASLFGMTYFQDVATIVKHHHEKYDGTGYPGKLKRDKIPYLSRIIAVADTVDAMMSSKAYRDRQSVDKIIKELSRCSGTQFDPDIAEKMIDILYEMNASSSEYSVSDTHFVPQAALSFFYKDVHHIYSFSGNLILQEDRGKLLVHSDLELLDSLESEHIHRCTLSYYHLSDLLEFSINVDGILHDQVYISDFRSTPTDKYFSIIWDGDAIIENGSIGMYSIKMIKLGGDTIVFDADEAIADDLVKHRGEIMKIRLELEIDDETVYMSLDFKINTYYNFGSQITFVARFINISTGNRDKILRVLFRKQMQQKQLKETARKGTRIT